MSLSVIRRLLRRSEKAPTLRDGFQTYALHGDKVWGGSITWNDRGRPHDDHHRRVVGWTSPRPRAGDRLLVAMESGRWGVWVFVDVVYCDNPSDMFFADVVGAIGYADEGEVPARAQRHTSVFRV